LARAVSLLLRYALTCAALVVTIHIVPGLSFSGGPLWVLAAALALGFLNLLARPVLFVLKLVTFPLSCLTLGLWTLGLTLFVNILVFYFVSSLGWGFRADSFWAAGLGALVMSAANAALTGLAGIARTRD
jgi:putative membrane protein